MVTHDRRDGHGTTDGGGRPTRRTAAFLAASALAGASFALAAVWAASHLQHHNGYAAMSHHWRDAYAPPQDTGLRLVPGAFYVMADQRVGAPPGRGPIPYWSLVLATGAWPAWRFAVTCRRRTRRGRATARTAAGLCPACGYDLRASSGRCPECGAER